jgi:uncharacterized lipoprotein YajG
MKKLIFLATAALLLAGCQQTEKLQGDAAKMVDTASKQIETAKTSVLDAKNKLDEKVSQAQEAADAIKKLGE